ncbi:PIG-L deacetylase family protein [Parvularcula sp. IMCC14364]|uniref:PIG-L deacetylase family protein n=1 Tax=Parvularcula sp. IMCC14364 TaxID=3067902 RepID=UPI002740411F|nr:PIG-L family deacetylase [Parvularcula sp. IMCC14364]
MIIRILTITALVAFLVLAGRLFWFDSQFEEPDAAFVPSLTGELEARSVLAVFAHPDDEQLVTGLLLRAKKRDGAITRMITATKGEAGNQTPVVARQEELGIIRHAEALKSGFALGLDAQEVWDYPDSGVATADYAAIVRRLAASIKKWQPDLVVTFWPESGFSNHPDHMLIGQAARDAVLQVRRTEPELSPDAIAYVLAPRRMMARFGGEPGQIVVANQPAPTHAMPGEAKAKIRGWEIHASQRNFVRDVYGMPAWFLHRVNDKEFYFVEVVQDTP